MQQVPKGMLLIVTLSTFFVTEMLQAVKLHWSICSYYYHFNIIIIIIIIIINKYYHYHYWILTYQLLNGNRVLTYVTDF